jgi:hypothetical protein
VDLFTVERQHAQPVDIEVVVNPDARYGAHRDAEHVTASHAPKLVFAVEPHQMSALLHEQADFTTRGNRSRGQVSPTCEAR